MSSSVCLYKDAPGERFPCRHPEHLIEVYAVEDYATKEMVCMGHLYHITANRMVKPTLSVRDPYTQQEAPAYS